MDKLYTDVSVSMQNVCFSLPAFDFFPLLCYFEIKQRLRYV